MAKPARQVLTASPTVTVRSERFGELVVPEERIITFEAGLIGLPVARRFVLLEPTRAGSPFRRLVCLDDPELGFVLCDPEEFWPGYRQHVPRPGAVTGELAVLVVVTVPTNAVEMTANLLAPLVVDIERLAGWQLILDGADYQTQHRVFPSAAPSVVAPVGGSDSVAPPASRTP